MDKNTLSTIKRKNRKVDWGTNFNAFFKLDVLFAFFALILSACISQPTIVAYPTDTPTPIKTITPTIIWFPKTSTSTTQPRAIITPTPNALMPIGNLLLHDGFSKGEQWNLGKQPSGTIALGVNEITLTVIQPEGYESVFRKEPNISDFYLEIMANPTLCNAGDEYGLLLRGTSTSSFYRFSLSCNGQMSVDLIYNGTATSPQPWIKSAYVPKGAPSQVQIGVLANANEISFWLDDQYQFSITDKLLNNGLIGLFARADGDSAVTINFSDLYIYSLKDQ